MKKLNQKGFSAPHLLLVLVIIGLIGGVGYYVYRANQDINKNLDTTVSSQNNVQKADKKPEETPKEDTPPPSDKYLEIKEYGVKLELSDAVKDAYYTVENGYVYLSVHKLDKYPACDKLVSITKAKPGDDRYGSPWTEKELKAIAKLQVGNTYYFMETGGGGSCSDPTTKNHDEAETIAKRELGNAKLLEL